MIKNKKGNIDFYQSEKLIKHSCIEHFFSTRKGNFNEIEYISNEIGFDSKKTIIPKQTHSANVAIVRHQNISEKPEESDALITNEQGICIAVKTADCTPILLFDPVQKVIAAIHSGWRGTAQNITGKTIQQMVLTFNSETSNVIAAIGPGIGQSNYEVGCEVVEQFKRLFPNTDSILDFKNYSNGKAKLNVKNAIIQQLLSEGITMKNIEFSDFCTFEYSTDFYSARRDGAKTGRMINGILLK